MKVITVCGSMKFEKEMLDIARDLETKHGHCVIQCIYGANDRQETLEELENIKNSHFKKIDMADIVYVVDIGGYIGNTTQEEIGYALSHGKEVILHSKKDTIDL